MNRIQRTLELSNHALVLLEEEIRRHDQGTGTVGTLPQLLECKRQLREMITQVETGKVPSRAERLYGMGHMVADSWPLTTELGEALLAAEQAYRAL